MRRLLLVALLACSGSEKDPGEASPGRAEVGGSVVSTVEGHPITTDDVAALVRRGELAADEALGRLQGELLLSLEAEREGLADDALVLRETRRAAVQALLAQVEAEVDATVSEEALRELYERQLPQMTTPAQRGVAHVLVRVAEGAPHAVDEAARARADAIRVALIADPELERWRAEGLVVEELPLFAPDGALEPAFRDAAFAVTEPGVAPDVVRTSYGWHAILVRHALDEHRPTFEARRDELREQVIAERRFERLRMLVARLEQEIGVERDDAAIERAMRLEIDW